jgi:hypothetical protein
VRLREIQRAVLGVARGEVRRLREVRELALGRRAAVPLLEPRRAATQIRLIVPEGASGCAVAFVRSDGLAPDPPAGRADIGPVWLYNEVPACRVLPWRGSKEVRAIADL